MKTLSTIITTVTLLLTSLTLSFASGHGDTVDTSITYNSGILVLAFAGFLALIVVVQTIPAFISLYGMIKGASEAAKSRKAAISAHNK